jgi:dTDP-glucose 4,6-dehydratase
MGWWHRLQPEEVRMRLIVTGGAGFIGSAAVSRAVHAGHDVLTIDKLTYAGRREALAEVMLSPNHSFVHADVADSDAMDTALHDFDPDAVLHLAAESHVDRSIDDPEAFVATNVRGTFVLLEAALRHWSRLRGARRESFRFVQISTDEVFGELTEDGPFNASSRYAPNSPYAASKAAADHFARAWYQTYGVPVIVTNCSNNYGPRQHAEKLIPTVIRHALAGVAVPIYGTGANLRDWLYVEDHVRGLMAALRHGRPGQTYLFGGRCERRNLDLAKMICALLDARRPRNDGKPYAQQITFVMERPGHDFHYAVDPSYAESALGWKADERLDTGLAKTVDWYLAHADWLIPVKELGRLGTRVVEIAETPS